MGILFSGGFGCVVGGWGVWYLRKCVMVWGKWGRNEEGKNGLMWVLILKWSVDYDDFGFLVGGFWVMCVLEGEGVKDILVVMLVNWMVKRLIWYFFYGIWSVCGVLRLEGGIFGRSNISYIMERVGKILDDCMVDEEFIFIKWYVVI